MAWINLALGAYAIWRAFDLKREGRPAWSWASMGAVGAGLVTMSAVALV